MPPAQASRCLCRKYLAGKKKERVLLKNMYCFHDVLSKVSRELCCSKNCRSCKSY